MTETPPEFLPDLPDVCWPVDVSCIPDWTAEPAVYTAEEKARALALSVQSLRYLTLYRVGGCPVTVRPASQSCRARTMLGDRGLSWMPVNLGGEWINIGCGHSDGCCSCLGAREVALGQASQIVEVRVDGEVLPGSAYRLDPGGRLVRLDGESWPLCQNLAAPNTDPGTWSVTYLPGYPVDGLGAYVAGLLAREFLRACSGGQCELPSTVTQVVRGGVTLTMSPGLFPGGLTGIREVDAWTEAWNPHRVKSPSGVWSPDLEKTRPRVSGDVGPTWAQLPDSIDGGTP